VYDRIEQIVENVEGHRRVTPETDASLGLDRQWKTLSYSRRKLLRNTLLGLNTRSSQIYLVKTREDLIAAYTKEEICGVEKLAQGLGCASTQCRGHFGLRGM